MLGELCQLLLAGQVRQLTHHQVELLLMILLVLEQFYQAFMHPLQGLRICHMA